MSRYILEIMDDGETELVSEDTDESVWSSYDDEDFDGDPTDAEAVTDYLVKKEIIESENEIVEIVDETGEYEILDDEDNEADDPEVNEISDEDDDDD